MSSTQETEKHNEGKTKRVLSAEEREWLTANEDAMHGCMFAVSTQVRGRMTTSDAAHFRTGKFNRSLFCSTRDQPPIFYAGTQQFFYTTLDHVLLLYLQLAEAGQIDEEEAFRVWCASRQFPHDALGARPSLAMRAMLYMNHPADMTPARAILAGPTYEATRAELHAMLDVKADDKAAFSAFFDSAWLLCVNTSRAGQRRTADFCNRITTNERDMGIVMDNVCVAYTLDTMRWLMDYFGQPTPIDTETIRGVQYACLSRAYYGPFFMVMHGLSLINRSRLPACYRSGSIVNLSRFFVHYQRVHVADDSHFAYNAWLFALIQSTLPDCKLALARRDVALRVRCAIEGAEACKLEGALSDIHQHVVRHRVIDLRPFADVLQTLQCALLRVGDKMPRDFVVTIRSTLLAAVVDNIVHSSLPDAWRAALIAESAALHPTDDTEVVYLELRHFGVTIMSALWDQYIDWRAGRLPEVHPAWVSVLQLVPRHGFRTSMHPSFSPIQLRDGVDCFLAHPAAYTRTELILRLFEMCWCATCHEGAINGTCGHLPHDIDTRGGDIDLCDVRVASGGATYAECASFSGVPSAHYYLFRAVTDPSLRLRMLERLPLPPMHPVCS